MSIITFVLRVATSVFWVAMGKKKNKEKSHSPTKKAKLDSGASSSRDELEEVKREVKELRENLKGIQKQHSKYELLVSEGQGETGKGRNSGKQYRILSDI